MICIIACTDNKVLLVEWANSASCYTYFACASYSCSSFQTSIHLIKMQMEILQIARILDQLCEWERKYMDSGQSRRTWWWHVVLLLPHTQSYTQTQAHTHTHTIAGGACGNFDSLLLFFLFCLPIVFCCCLEAATEFTTRERQLIRTKEATKYTKGKGEGGRAAALSLNWRGTHTYTHTLTHAYTYVRLGWSCALFPSLLALFYVLPFIIVLYCVYWGTFPVNFSMISLNVNIHKSVKIAALVPVSLPASSPITACCCLSVGFIFPLVRISGLFYGHF